MRAKPSDIPVKLAVDVSPLEIGDVIHVSAIALPAGVTSITGRDLAVVTCAAPEEEKVATTAEAAPAEGAAAAAAAAPAAGAAAAGKDAKAAAAAKDAKARARRGKAAPAAAAKPAARSSRGQPPGGCRVAASSGWAIPARSTRATATTSASRSSTSSPPSTACRPGRPASSAATTTAGVITTERGRERAVLLKPMEFMNLSGFAVQRTADFHHVDADDILVVHDEIDLELGVVRLKSGGGHGGHNGLRSIMEQLGSGKFARLRMGVGRDPNVPARRRRTGRGRLGAVRLSRGPGRRRNRHDQGGLRGHRDGPRQGHRPGDESAQRASEALVSRDDRVI